MNRKNSHVYKSCARALRQAVHNHCDDTKDRGSDVAEMLGVQYSTLNNYTNGHAPIPLDLFVSLIRETEDYVAMDSICRLADGHFISTPKTSGEGSLVNLVKEFGEAVAACSDAMKDDVVSHAELAKCEPEIADVVRAALQLLEHMKSMSEKPRRVATLADTQGSL